MVQTPTFVMAPDGSSTKVLTFSSAHAVTIGVADRDHISDDGSVETIQIGAPGGSHALYTASRMKGDWYAEFTAGRTIKSAVGSNQAEAIAAAAKAFRL